MERGGNAARREGYTEQATWASEIAGTKRRIKEEGEKRQGVIVKLETKAAGITSEKKKRRFYDIDTTS